MTLYINKYTFLINFFSMGVTTFPVTGTSCHATFNCMKRDIQTEFNKNISLL